MSTALRIIRASSREQNDLLAPRISSLRADGFEVRYDDVAVDPTWPFSAAAPEVRARALTDALLETGTAAVLCARGGYGASDLLPLLPWDLLEGAPPKLLVGFSDVSALHSALFARLGWPMLHAPMPATALWGKDGESQDVSALLHLLRQHASTGQLSGEMHVVPRGNAATRAVALRRPVEGKLFGGCFTVLTNLIGTPYIPRSLAGRILFIEDTDEHPARLMRSLNQWIQSGLLEGASALVIGYMRGLGEKIPDCAPFVYDQFAQRLSDLPVFCTPAFGHTSPNAPLLIGASARIASGALAWRHSKGDLS